MQAAYEHQVAKVPNHRVVMADDARHFIMFDAPDFLWRTIDAFLASAKTALPPAAAPRRGGDVEVLQDCRLSAPVP